MRIRHQIKRLALVAAALLCFMSAPGVERAYGQSNALLAPTPKPQFFDNNGVPLAGGLLSTFLTGTATPQATFTDAAMTTPNANPIVLDSAGRCTIYLNPSVSYKFVLKTSASVTLWTVDPVTPVNAGNVGLGEFFNFGGAGNSPITAAAYFTGSTLQTLHPGSAMWNVDTLNIPPGNYKVEGDGIQTSGTNFTCGLMNLSDGAPDTPLVTMVFTSTTGERILSNGVTLATGGSAKNYGIKCLKTGGGTGYGWGFKIVRVS